MYYPSCWSVENCTTRPIWNTYYYRSCHLFSVRLRMITMQTSEVANNKYWVAVPWSALYVYTKILYCVLYMIGRQYRCLIRVLYGLESRWPVMPLNSVTFVMCHQYTFIRGYASKHLLWYILPDMNITDLVITIGSIFPLLASAWLGTYQTIHPSFPLPLVYPVKFFINHVDYTTTILMKSSII